MTAVASLPGVRFAIAAAISDPSPLRSDIGGFAGRLRRGPIGRAVRVEGWRELCAVFGGLRRDANTPYSLRGYFENDGQVAHLVRVAGPGASHATAAWTIGLPAAGGFASTTYEIRATSPGEWANGTTVEIEYRRDGRDGHPELDLIVRSPEEPTETHTRVDSARLSELGSALIEVIATGPAPVVGPPGPRHASWLLSLSSGHDAPPTRDGYAAALEVLGDIPEVAIVGLPDLNGDIVDDAERYELLAAALRRAQDLHDRFVVIDVPPTQRDATAAIDWVAGLRAVVDDDALRAGAVYHPAVRVNDPLGGSSAPQRNLPACGHVAGVVSRLDRERGAHHSPANAPIVDAVDVDVLHDDIDLDRLSLSGIDPIICRCGRGLQIWGARTLDHEHPNHRFLAHRRLVHRLVRAIRRVAEPLVFDTNGPELWLALARASTTVLLDAYRGGALKGSRPGDAFRVRCDAKTNPASERELGRCLCEIDIAPAVPMEFITLRIALSTDGRLEVT